MLLSQLPYICMLLICFSRGPGPGPNAPEESAQEADFVRQFVTKNATHCAAMTCLCRLQDATITPYLAADT